MRYPHISCFDLDHTLLTSTSSFRFGVYLYRKKAFSTRTMLYLVTYYGLHKIRFISMEKMQQKIFDKLFLGRSFPKMLSLAKDFVDCQFDSLLYHPVVQCLKEAQRQGHYTVILSSSPSFLVELFAKRFHVDAWDGTRYELDNSKCFSSIARMVQGEDKAKYLLELKERFKMTKQQLTAYSDSYLDIPFLDAAGNAVGVNPDKKLRKLCITRNWQILS